MVEQGRPVAEQEASWYIFVQYTPSLNYNCCHPGIKQYGLTKRRLHDSEIDHNRRGALKFLRGNWPKPLHQPGLKLHTQRG